MTGCWGSETTIVWRNGPTPAAMGFTPLHYANMHGRDNVDRQQAGHNHAHEQGEH